MPCKVELQPQLAPWSSVGAPPCREVISGPDIPLKFPNLYQSDRPQPWRPVSVCNGAEVMPLPNVVVTNKMMDPCYTPKGMTTEPMTFPNLVTGFNKNPSHASRAALYTRYTPHEWTQQSLTQFNSSDTNRNFSERLRSDTVRVMRMTDEKTAAAQRESGRRLGERITDSTFWRNEVSTELERMVHETNLVQDTRRSVEKAIQDCEAPLHIAQECLYHREHRQGIDLVHDQPEQFLMKEVESIHNCQKRLIAMKEAIIQQLRSNRASQHELETDVKSKESAIGIDSVCHQINNFSRGINYYGGIEKFDNTVCVPETWAENSNRIVQRSQGERSKCLQMRTEADQLINSCANEIWNGWNNTNAALARRAAEVLEAKNKTEMHLHKVQQEIFDVEKIIELTRKAIMDKSNPLKVAQTRLEARTHRRDIEACKDAVQHRLVMEVHELSDSIDSLHRKLQEAESQHQQLLITRSNLESDLNIKVNSIFIDREKCLGMRRSFPIQATIQY